MAKDLADFVAGNRRDFRRSTTRFVDSAEDKQNGIYYGRTPVYTSVVTRLQDDSSGSFEDVSTNRVSGVVTVDGHELIAASAINDGSNPANILYGDDTSDADRFDTDLGNQLGSLSITSESTSGGLYEDPGTITLTSASTAASNLPSGGFEVGVGTGSTANPSQAQMLARVGHPPARIASESGVSLSEAQYLVRRISTDE